MGSSAALDRQAAGLSGRGSRAADTGDADPVRHAGAARARFRAAGCDGGDEHVLAPYRQVRRLALIGTAAAALLLLVVVHVVLRLNVRGRCGRCSR